MKQIVLSFIALLSINLLFGQVQEVWDETYGGSKNDEARSIIETTDGGYLVVGYTESEGSG